MSSALIEGRHARCRSRGHSLGAPSTCDAARTPPRPGHSPDRHISLPTTRGQQGGEDVFVVIDGNRQMRIVGIERRVAARDRVREVPAARHRYIPIADTAPHQDGDLDAAEIKRPRPRDHREIRCGTVHSPSAGFDKTRHPPGLDFRPFEERPVRLRDHRGPARSPPFRIIRKFNRNKARSSMGADRPNRNIMRSGRANCASMPGTSSGATPPTMPTARTRAPSATPRASA